MILGGRVEQYGTLFYRCNVCGSDCRTPASELHREAPTCTRCGSTPRMRAMVHALSLALFGRSIALPEFPHDAGIVGRGMSDWEGYAVPLAGKLGYVNTYYHKEPRLDITAIRDEDEGTLDFLLSTDVFEHVAPPVVAAFENARRLLKPTGALVFSVPYSLDPETIEHFPDLHEYTIESRDGERVLVNHTRAGERQEFRNLVFHGGEGETLEMRVFSQTGLLRELAAAGFADVRVVHEPCFEFGIWWRHCCSLPIIARVRGAGTEVSDWGPRETRRGQPVNAQQGGRSALWLKVPGLTADASVTVTVGGTNSAEVAVGDGLVSALIPDGIIDRPGVYPVTLRHGDTVIEAGEFTVAK